MCLIMSPKTYQINLANGILFFKVTINISSTIADYLLQNLSFLTFNLSPKAIT